MTGLVFVALGLGIAGTGGAAVGTALCKRRAGFCDGPRAMSLPFWMVPAASAALGAVLALRGVSAPDRLGLVAVVVVALAAAVATDARLGLVPDRLTLVPLAVIVLASGASGNWGPLLAAAIVGVPFAAAALASHGYGMGWADVKLIALAGAALGPPVALLAVALAAPAAFIAARTVAHRAHAPIAFVPFLALGVAAALCLIA